MRSSIISLLEQASRKMSGYAALLNYRFQNLSVLANPEALLSVNVMIDGDPQPIEKVARACNADGREDQFELYPLHTEYLRPLLKGLVTAHPEYKIELKGLNDNEESEDDEKFILATMPEVDKNRHDVLMDAVSTLSEGCDSLIKATVGRYSGEIALTLATAKPDEIKEATDALKNLQDRHDDLCKQFRTAKEKEIEDAYAQYQAREAEKEQEDVQKRQNRQAGLQMNWNSQDE